jgi:hypothetical protein
VASWSRSFGDFAVDAGGVAAGNEAEAEWAKVENELDANGMR